VLIQTGTLELPHTLVFFCREEDGSLCHGGVMPLIYGESQAFCFGGSHSQLDQAVTCLNCHLSADLTHRIARILDLFCRLPSEKNKSSFGNWTENSSYSTEIMLGSRMVYIGHMKRNREQLDGPKCSNYAYVRGSTLGPERVKSSHWW